MSRYAFTSAAEALARVRSGQHVLVGSGCAEPELLVGALCARAPQLHDVEVLHLLTAGAAPYADPALQDSFRHNAFFIGPNVRAAVRAGTADYTPCFLHEIPELIRSRRVPVDVALVQVSEPDAHGNFSLGISVDVLKAAVETAPLVIAQVNPRMPRTRGDSLLPREDFDLLVEGDAPLLELPARASLAEAAAIGRHCALLIEDGATLQMGIGAIPDAVLAALGAKNDLGVHTEMFSDGLLGLIRSGVVSGARKTLHRGRVVASFCMGTRALYEEVREHPGYEFRPSDYVNDPFVIARNERMAAINSALQVDLTGQVCADSIGARFYSGFGGQVDFIRGAARSRGGKAIVALPATAKGGELSRIVATLDPGAGVVTTRADVDYVVTEWGIASLKGRTARERALALISVAHPRFRAELLEKARGLGYVYPDQRPWPREGKPYPDECETRLGLDDGTSLEVRPLKASDERALRDLFYSHGEATVRARYGRTLARLPRAQVQEFVTLDYDRRMALGAFERRGRMSRLLGVARWDRPDAAPEAELRVTVRDDFQGRGIGQFLTWMLLRHARRCGLRRLRGDFEAGNARMEALARATGARLEFPGRGARRAVWDLGGR
ncbi:MAG: acetyl-CoA hydrolase/transferase family protein [Elusimicrobia bacterium]|nr:acetyl-CoA hydrolase/transferase family protein [Elusimicrobiota bacterium]